MGETQDNYNWQNHDDLKKKIVFIDSLLIAIDPCLSGKECDARAMVLRQYEESNGLTPADAKGTITNPYHEVNMEPLVAKLVRTTAIHVDFSVRRAYALVAYLEDIYTSFPQKECAGEVDEEMEIRGLHLGAILQGLEMAAPLYGDPRHPYHDMGQWQSAMTHLEAAQMFYDELYEKPRPEDVPQDKEARLKAVFNMAEKQTALSMLAYRHASCTIKMADECVDIMIGIAVSAQSHRKRLAQRMQELKTIAVHMLSFADFALDEAARLSSDACEAHEVSYPLFRLISLQYPAYRLK